MEINRENTTSTYDNVYETLYDEEDTQKNRYLTFLIENECFGLEIKYVTEIIGMHPITSIPEQADFIMGIINLRGKIIPVMDIRKRFKKTQKDYNDRTCIIVIEIDTLLIGLIVDSVWEVITIAEENIMEPPRLGSIENKYLKYIGKVGNEVKLLLNAEKLLTDDIQEELKELNIEKEDKE